MDHKIARRLSIFHLIFDYHSLILGVLGLGMAFNDLGDQKAGLSAANRIFKVFCVIFTIFRI